MQATVVITTRNRKQDLRQAIESALTQTAKPNVLVVDDGSTDGTAEMVRADYPAVQLERAEKSLGYIVQRTRAATLATTEIIISIDDDAAFSTPHVVQQTLADFDHPRVGAVAIPFINVNRENVVHQRAPDDTHVVATSDYIGTAHAVRRQLFLDIGGYRSFLFHQGEERDFCIRMLDRGFVVRLGRADPILHYESPRRDIRRMDLFGRRNDILFVWHNVPGLQFPVFLLGWTYLGLAFGFKVRRPMVMIRGLGMGYAGILHEWSKRKPVTSSTHRLFRRLNREKLAIEKFEQSLPALPSA